MTAKAWIESRRYDLPLIVLSPLMGLLFVAAARAFSEKTLVDGYVTEANFFFLGMPHYLSSYTFYMDDANLAYYKTRRAAFFAGPVLIVLLLTLSLRLHYYYFVAALVDLWNVYHVSRQSIGILSIYRHRSGGDNRAERLPSNLGLLSLNAGLFFLHIERNASVSHFLGYLPSFVQPALGPLLLVSGITFLGWLVWRMSRRAAGPSPAELLFLCASVVLFLPYAFLQDYKLAGTAMLSGHYVQYLGLIWLLNHRKYVAEAGSWRQRALVGVSRSIPTILALILIVGATTFLADNYVHRIRADAFHAWSLNIVALLHFYVDGLCWAFRRPFVRNSIAPFLVTGATGLPQSRLAVA